MADVDLDHSCTLNKKIQNAQLAQYNFILGNLNLYVFSQMLIFVQLNSKKLHKKPQNKDYGITTGL